MSSTSREVLGVMDGNIDTLPSHSQSKMKRTPITLMKRRQSRQEKRLSILELIRPWGLLHPEDFKHIVESLSEEVKSEILEVISTEEIIRISTPSQPFRYSSEPSDTPSSNLIVDENYQALGQKLLSVLRESTSPQFHGVPSQRDTCSPHNNDVIENTARPIIQFSAKIESVAVNRPHNTAPSSDCEVKADINVLVNEQAAFASSKKVPRTPPTVIPHADSSEAPISEPIEAEKDQQQASLRTSMSGDGSAAPSDDMPVEHGRKHSYVQMASISPIEISHVPLFHKKGDDSCEQPSVGVTPNDLPVFSVEPTSTSLVAAVITSYEVISNEGEENMIRVNTVDTGESGQSSFRHTLMIYLLSW